MPATFTERLDELLGLASYAGRCAVRLAAAETAHRGARHGRKAEPARHVRECRRDLANAERRLASARARFLRGAPDLPAPVVADDT